MIVLDVNLLLYAYTSSSIQHKKACDWLTGVFSGDELVGLPWQTIHAFLRISTDKRITADPFPLKRVLGVVQQWLDMPQVRILVPSERHWALLQRMLNEGKVNGPMTTDAQLAALTLEYGGVLHTADRDFARFPGLRWVNPLSEA
jgi:toxin-antitoxin system PIN domain toxin